MFSTWLSTLVLGGLLAGLPAPVARAAPVPVAASSAGAPQQRPAATGAPSAAERMIATAYGPSTRDNYPFPAVDFFGRPLRPGDVAVDPRVIPLGTKLFISGYRSPYLPPGGFVAVARDTGGAVRGMHVDIFLDAGTQAVRAFGVQHVQVTVLGQ